jgi:hypothetical protein
VGEYSSKNDWLIEPRRRFGDVGDTCEDPIAPLAAQVRHLRINVSDDFLRHEYGGPESVDNIIDACGHLESAEITLSPYSVSCYGDVDNSVAYTFPKTLRHLHIELGLLEDDTNVYQGLWAQYLISLRSLTCRGVQLDTLPPSLRTLDCQMWCPTKTSEESAFSQPDGLTNIIISADENSWDSSEQVWISGGEGGGVTGGEKLAKMLCKAEYVEIEALLPDH